MVLLISFTLLMNVACGKEEKIIFDYRDQINVLHQLANKDSNNNFIRPEEDYYVFYSDNEYKTFAKQYFTETYESEYVDFQKSDLLLINFKWGDKLKGPSYKVNSLVKKNNDIKIFIENSGFGGIDNKDVNYDVEELGYIQLPKGTILSTDIVLINKK